ncbi:MAG TPA: single-stranded-DNA-specific exonuclease RecJ [Sphingomonadales bacterium]|nr:single-stranded-DNA-specific exonuclease RecJ [Sphingomonadales bacterium]
MTNSEQQEEFLLGVEESVTGRAWVRRPAEYRIIQAIAQQHDLPEIVARVVAGRGIDLDHASAFLTPTLREALPDPSRFKDMDKACARVAEALEQGQKIAVFGDYDVDGATSSALLKRFFAALSQELIIYIPDRIKEGYGPSAKALLDLKSRGADLVITVDCGIVSFEPLQAAQDAGLDVIVMDHHQAEPRLPAAVAVVNPNRIDEAEGYGQLAAVGGTFIFAVGINRLLRQKNWYADQNIDPPDLMKLLDLVALGTICDVVPLVGVNRALVAQGLKVMANRGNAGIRALGDVAGVKEEPGTYHAGFLIGPRVNAGGRVGRAEVGALILSTDDEVEAMSLAHELHTYNAERQAIEHMVLEQAMAQVAGRIGPGGVVPPVIIAASPGWHTGVIGIVAGRLKEFYQRPTIVIGIDDDGVGKGSGRSIYGVDLGAAVTAARQAGLLSAGGGHAMAAGLTVAADRIDDLGSFMTERMTKAVGAALKGLSLKLDGILTASGVTVALVDQLGHIGPYGQGNAQPRFALPNVTVQYADVVGKDHVKCTLKGADGGVVKAMAFRSADQPLGQLILGARGRQIHVAGTLRRNSWNGRVTAEIFIDDAAAV